MPNLESPNFNRGPANESVEKAKESPNKIPLPGGYVPEYRRWQTRVNQSGETSGYTDPEGQFHALKPGVKFVIERDRANNQYTAMEVGPDGTKTIIRTGEMVPNFTKETKDNESAENTLLEGIDRERLNEIVEKASSPGALYGKHFSLEKGDREQIELVAAKAEELIDRLIKNDPEWKILEKTIEDLNNKGWIMYSAIFPPPWLINGGDSVSKVKVEDGKDGQSSILVPEKIYNAYYWKGVIHRLRGVVRRDDESVRGTMANPLGENLRKIAYLFKSNQK